MATSKRIVLHFPSRLIEEPLVFKLVKDYNLTFNIIKASISPGREGLLVMELAGEQRDYDRGIKYLTDNGVRIQSLSQDVTRNEARCTHCGACVTLCPVGAFTVEPGTRRVQFDNTKCVLCEMCVKACPPRAMEVYF
jgi:ferredoxin